MDFCNLSDSTVVCQSDVKRRGNQSQSIARRLAIQGEPDLCDLMGEVRDEVVATRRSPPHPGPPPRKGGGRKLFWILDWKRVFSSLVPKLRLGMARAKLRFAD